MSDFFGDDFTAELKSYFLNSIILEVDKFIDLTDESLWRRIHSEVCEQTRAWAVDARTNEYQHLAQWLESFEEKSRNIQEATELVRALKTAKAYVEALLQEKTDSADLAAHFVMSAQNLREIQLLHCRAGKHEFAVPILSVIEISTGLSIYSLPQRKEGILGVIPYRGEAVPVVNLQDYGFAVASDEKSCFLICEQQGVRFSLQITRTEDMLSLKESELQCMEKSASMISVPFAQKFFIRDERSVMVLDLNKLVA